MPSCWISASVLINEIQNREPQWYTLPREEICPVWITSHWYLQQGDCFICFISTWVQMSSFCVYPHCSLIQSKFPHPSRSSTAFQYHISIRSAYILALWGWKPSFTWFCVFQLFNLHPTPTPPVFARPLIHILCSVCVSPFCPSRKIVSLVPVCPRSHRFYIHV